MGLVKYKPALLLIASPTHAAFSRPQPVSARKLGPDKIEEMLEHGVQHLKFALELCEIQRSNGQCFQYERPASATSRTTSTVQRMLQRRDVKTYEACACCYDMKQIMYGEEVLAQKPTRFTTNSPINDR